jgi:hypothetical protein
LDNGIRVDADRRGRDASLKQPAHLASDRFDSAQCKAKFGDVLVGSDQEIVDRRQRGRHQHHDNQRDQANRSAPAACGEFLRLKNGNCSAVLGWNGKSGCNGGFARLGRRRADPIAGRPSVCRQGRHQAFSWSRRW